MDPNTLLTVGFVVLAGATLLVTAHAGAVVLGVLPEVRDANGETRTFDDDAASGADLGAGVPRASDDPDANVSSLRDDADAGESAPRDDTADGSRLTDDDRERIRNHLEKDPFRRRPDDLLPSDDEGS
jgi:hypothetical protein